MADFYPVLARAVSALRFDTPQARQELYEHARKTLVNQMRGRDPSPSAPEMIREQVSLETAVRRLEAEFSLAQIYAPKATASRRLKINGEKWATAITAGKLSPHKIIATCEQSTNKQTTVDMGALGWISGAGKQLPLPVMIDDHDQVSRAAQNVENLPVNSDEPPSDIANRQARLMLGEPKKLRSGPAGSHETAMNMNRWPFLGIALLATLLAMVAFIAIVCIALFLNDAPRLVWLLEHLVDHPTLLVLIPISLGLFVLAALPIFHKRRRKSAVSMLSRLTSSMPQSSF